LLFFCLLGSSGSQSLPSDIGEGQGDLLGWEVFLPERFPVEPSKVSAAATSFTPSRVVSSYTLENPAVGDWAEPNAEAAAAGARLTLQVVEPAETPPANLAGVSAPTTFSTDMQAGNLTRIAGLAFVLADVYDNHHTLLRIFPHDGGGAAVVAWSNIDFNVFEGWSSYRIRKADGTFQEQGLLLGLANLESSRLQQLAIQAGRIDIPPLPQGLQELAVAGPAFQVLEGNQGSAAMEILQQLHELYRREGERMKQVLLSKREAESERQANVSANPPNPPDVTIRYWKVAPAETSGTEAAE